ncbi:MAG: NADH-quinone oxidoreductase subunit NuoH [Firmicutes bacterium]|nr:NADH-quinone oxidoreductase subunit NuoH [Bacillota bacterium]
MSLADLWAQHWFRAFVTGSLVLVFALGNFYITLWLERKESAWIQNRLGPMRAGPQGLLQVLADLFKLLQKEDIVPRNVDRILFLIAPFIAHIPALLIFLVVPFGPNMVVADYDIGIIMIAAVTSYAVIATFIAGWGSNNKYSLLGAMRGAAQMISYEVTLVMSVIGVVMMAGSLKLSDIVLAQAERGVLGWYLFPQFIGFIVYLIASLAELNRAPFDLMEAESELVAGYHTEYSGFRFAIFLLVEYVHMIAWSAIAATLFLGGWVGPTPADIPVIGPKLFGWMTGPVWDNVWGFFWFLFKTYLLIFILIWIRWTFPRVRIDQLMDLGWKFLLPVSLFNIFLTGVMKYGWNVLAESGSPLRWIFWLWR